MAFHLGEFIGGCKTLLLLNGNGTDASGNSDTGVITGATSVPAGGWSGGCYSFADNSTNHILCTNNIPSQPFTFGMLFKRNGVPGGMRIIGGTNYCHATYTYHGRLELETSGKVNMVKMNSGVQSLTTVAGNTVVTDNKWHLITGVYNGTSHKLYIDGSLDNSTAAGNATTFTASPFAIGCDPYNFDGYGCGGYIDMAFMYPGELSAAQIRTIYRVLKFGE